jgi:hypothetical protein
LQAYCQENCGLEASERSLIESQIKAELEVYLMKTNSLLKLTGVSLLALGMTIVPTTFGTALAQDTNPAVEGTALDETPTENLQDAQNSLQQAGQEAVEGVESAGAAAQQDLQEAIQDATRTTQEASLEAQQNAETAAQDATAAAERAELAAENAAENVQEGFDWGWLGLLGLIGLFGLAGGNKRRVEVDERYRQTPTTTTTTNDYR